MRGFFVREADGVRLLTPFDQHFVNLLKEFVPPRGRAWDPDSRSWLVREPYVGLALSLAQRSFAPMVPLQPAGQAPAPSHTPAACLARIRELYSEEAELWLLPNAPPAVVQAVYRALAKECHPDVVGAGGNDDMVRLNRAFETLNRRAR